MPTVLKSDISTKGLEFIAKYEGLKLNLYNDIAGHATIGVGHLVHKGPINGSEPEEFKKGITKERAFQLLKEDAASAVSGVNSQVKVALNQGQFDALVSFVFNLGAGAFQKSTLLKKLNANDFAAVPAEFLKWNKAGGNVVKGLTIRRQAEADLFSTGNYGL